MTDEEAAEKFVTRFNHADARTQWEMRKCGEIGFLGGVNYLKRELALAIGHSNCYCEECKKITHRMNFKRKSDSDQESSKEKK